MKLRKRIFWGINFLILALFSVYALSGTLGFGAKHAFAETLDKNNFFHQSQHFVVVKDDLQDSDAQQGQAVGDLHPDVICSLTPTQAAQLNAFFNVKISNIPVSSSQTVQLAIVSGHLTKSELLNFLRATDMSLDCQVVSVAHVFFLPVIPQIS